MNAMMGILVAFGLLTFLTSAPARGHERGGYATSSSQGSDEGGSLRYQGPPKPIDAKDGDGQMGTVKVKCEGQWQWKFKGDKGEAKCSEFDMEEGLAQLIDHAFQKCVAAGARAAGIASNNQAGFSGSVDHVGCKGDHKHAEKKSLHNIYRAIDVAGIEVNGSKMDYAKACSDKGGKEAKFFEAFRDCWGYEGARGEKAEASCKNGTAETPKGGFFGSIGCEDKDHNKHVHLSLPVCGSLKAQANKNASMIAYMFKLPALVNWLWSHGEATASTYYGFPDKIALKLKDGSELKGRAEFIGEPVALPVSVELHVKCSTGQEVLAIETGTKVCDYEGVKEDSANKEIVVAVRRPIIKNGHTTCGEKDRLVYKNPCRAPAAVTPAAPLPGRSSR